MFKSFISYLLGFFAGFTFFVSYIENQPMWFLSSIIITVSTFVIAQFVSHRVHKRMQKQHETMLRTGGIKK